MGDLTSGTHDGFSWIESHDPRLGLRDLVGGVPEVLIGKCLVIASFDSGALNLEPPEIQQGWRAAGELAVLDPVRSLEGLPCGGFDEWYVFAGKPKLDPLEVFINYAPFGLSKPPPHDHSLRALQKRFWSQLSEIGAESYLGEGGKVHFVTTSEALFEKASKVLKEMPGRKT